MFCENCGTKSDSTKKFCTNCEKELSNTTKTESSQAQSTPNFTKPKFESSWSAGRYIEVSYARPSDISFPSFPYLFIGHGAHWFDNSLLNKQMTLGELFEKEIEIKTKQLEAIKENLQKFKEKV